MKGMLKEPGKRPRIIEVGDDIKELQEVVGGYIEMHKFNNSVYVLCDEDGRCKGAPENAMVLLTGMVRPVMLVGNILVVGRTKAGNMTSLQKKYYGLFAEPPIDETDGGEGTGVQA